MKCILKIGYHEYLLPDDTGAATVIKTLSRAVRVRERLYKQQVALVTKDEGDHEISMRMVPPNTKFVSEETGEPVTIGRERPVRHHPTSAGQRQLGY